MAALVWKCIALLVGVFICSSNGAPEIKERRYIPDETCEDNAPNCEEYSLVELCHDPAYTDWRLKYCKLTCGLCGQSTPQLTTTQAASTVHVTTHNIDPNCFDTISNCHEYQADTCTNPYFTDWAKKHCSHFCGFCHGTTTTPAPTTTTTPHPEGHTCYDRLECENYDMKTSCCGDYEPWARTNCAKYCKFCKAEVTEAPLCHDTDSKCPLYGDDLCTNPSYDRFVREHCAGTCKICEQPEFIPECASSSTVTSAPVTTAAPGSCVDIEDCSRFDIKTSCCGPYEAWARHHCPKTCKFCYPSVPEIPLCTDTDPLCGQYGDDLCTDPTYDRFIHENCAGTCKVCERPIFVPSCANTTSSSPDNKECIDGSVTRPEGSTWDTPDCKQRCTCENVARNQIRCEPLSCPVPPSYCSVAHLPGHCCPIIHDCRP